MVFNLLNNWSIKTVAPIYYIPCLTYTLFVITTMSINILVKNFVYVRMYLKFKSIMYNYFCYLFAIECDNKIK